MFTPTQPSSFLTPLFGSVLLALLLLLNGCGSAESARDVTSSRTLKVTPIDSTSGEPLDSARAVNRTFGDSLRTDSTHQFVLTDADPALYVFDISSYGYHTQQHVSVLVEPEDSVVSRSINLLPQRLNIDCTGRRPYFWETFTKRYREDTTRVRLQLTELFAEDGKVTVQPVLVNDLSSPLFLPDNFGALGHYEVLLYDGDNNRISYTHENAPHDDGHRIYSKADILPVVPKELERLEPSTLIVDDVEEGTTLYARMHYTFSPDATLETTSATTFPDLDLDTLQTPVFDTLRTAGEVEVPDTLVVKRDTTIMEVVGIDTTVTREGYTLFSTLRNSNAAPSPEAAREMLYVPDSVIARARRDSLAAAAETDRTVPSIDTAAATFVPDASLQIVDRENTEALRALFPDDDLVSALASGLPSLDMSTDSLLSFSTTLRSAYLQTPSLAQSKVRRGLDTTPDSARTDSVIVSAPASDSLFQLFSPDSLAGSDSANGPDQVNPFVYPDPSARLAPDTDSIPVDSLPLTIAPASDSVTVDSVVSEYLSDPPPYSYWYVPSSYSREGNRTLVVDPSFFRLRAQARVDTTANVNLNALLPKRVGHRKQLAHRHYPQQVIRTPAGTYRSKYLNAWKELQEENLRGHYCEIFPFPLQSDWRSASMR